MADFFSTVGVRAVVENLAGFRSGMSIIRNEAGRANQGMFALATSSATASGAVTNAGNSITRAFGGVSSTVASTTALGRSLSAIGTAGRVALAPITAINAAFRAGLQATLEFGIGIRNLGARIRLVGNELTNVGARISTFISIPLALAGAGVLSTGADFESAMTKVITLVGVSESVVSDWGDTILETAADLGALPTELAEGLFVITSAGIRDSTEAMALLQQASKASSVGLGETSDVARLATSAVQTYGLANLSSADAIDQLLVAVRAGNIEADSLAGSFGRVIATAAALNVSFADSLAFVSTFTRAGTGAEVAVTSLRSVLTSILKPTQAAQDVLAGYGLTIGDVRSAIEDDGLAQALVDLREHLGIADVLAETGSSLEQVQQQIEDIGLDATLDSLAQTDASFARLIGTSRGLAGALFVTGEIGETYVDIQDQIRNATGATAVAFAEVSKTIEFQSNQARAGLQALGIEIFKIVLPSVNALIQRLLSLIERIRELIRENPKFASFAIALALVGAAAGPVIFIIGALISSLGAIVGFIGTAISFFAALAAAVTLPLLPIGVLVAAFAALGSLLILTARDIQQKMTVSFGNLAQSAFGFGHNLVLQFARGMIQAVTFVIQALAQLGAVIANFLRPGSPPKLLPNIDKWGQETAQVWIDAWGTADFSVFNDIAGTIEGFLRSFGGDDTSGLIERILGSRNALAEATSQFQQFGTVSQDVLGRVSDIVGQNQRVIQDYVSSMFDLEAANRRVAAAQREVNKIQEAFNSLLDPLNRRLAEISDTRQDFIDVQRIQELQDILNDPEATGDARFLAQLELEEIDARSQVRDLELERDAQLSVAEARLQDAEAERDRIQEQVSLLEKQIEFQVETNRLLNEQAQALESVAGAVGGVGEALGDIGNVGAIGDLGDIGDLSGIGDGLGLGDVIEELQGEVEGFFNEGGTLDTILANAETFFADFIADLAPDLEGLNIALDDFSTAWADAFDQIPSFIERVSEKWRELREEQIPTLMLDIRERFDETREAVSKFLEPLSQLLGILADVATGINLVNIFSAAFSVIGNTITTALLPAMIGLWKELEGPLIALGESILPVLGVAFLAIGALILGTVLTAILLLTAGINGLIIGITNGINLAKEPLRLFFEFVAQIFLGIREIIAGFIMLFNGLIERDWAAAWEGVKLIAQGAKDILLGIIGAIVSSIISGFLFIIGFISGWVVGVISFFQDLYDELVGNSIVPELVDDIIEEFIRLKDDIIGEGGIIDQWVDGIIGPVEDLGSDIITSIGTWSQTVIDAFFQLGVDFITGLINGLLSIDLGAAAQGVANGLSQGVANGLQTNSPSRVAIGIGQDFQAGLLIGASDGLERNFSSAIQNSINRTDTSIIPPISGNQLGSRSTVVNMGGQTVRNDMDMALMKAFILDTVRDNI